MLRTELDAISFGDLLDLPIDTVVDEGFARDFWKPLWIEAAEGWFEDGGAMYEYMVNGFKGWAERTDFEVYCDLRATYVESFVTAIIGPNGAKVDETDIPAIYGMRWTELTGRCSEIGKYS